jgi:hypothetical protein
MRICEVPNCGTRLSRFNEDPFCAAHPIEPVKKSGKWSYNVAVFMSAKSQRGCEELGIDALEIDGILEFAGGGSRTRATT